MRDKIAEWRKLHFEEAYNLYSPETTAVIDLRSVRLAAHVEFKVVIINMYRILCVIPKGGSPQCRPRRTNLTLICQCITSIPLKYNQKDATFSRSIYFYKLLYMFQAVPPPIIRSTKLYIRRQVLSKQYCCLLQEYCFDNT